VKHWLNLLVCLIVLHTPDGGEVAVDTRQILMLQPAESLKHHVARGTETIVFLTGQRIAVREQPHEVEYLTKVCEDGAK
jgi:hypothetical protein